MTHQVFLPLWRYWNFTVIDVAGMYWCSFGLVPKFTWNLSAQLMQQSQDHVKIYKVEAKLHLLLEPWIHFESTRCTGFCVCVCVCLQSGSSQKLSSSSYWGFASENGSTWAEVVRRWITETWSSKQADVAGMWVQQRSWFGTYWTSTARLC